uniref:MADF domain-containing protein n=1 Tax=Panagrolaimus sp. ES5 TaxID=591445 RepID=A0AC34G625_9BILA
MSESSDLSFSPVSRSSPAASATLNFEGKSEETVQQEKNLEFTAQLISWVQRTTILYDHSHKQYRNAEKKLEAWNYVKNKVGYLGEAQELADHFKIIRDRYTKAKRKVAAEKPTKFQFLEQLSFLDPHITDRSSWYEKSVNGTRHKIIKTPKVNNSNFYLQLIQMVQQNPCFYDTTDPYYRKYCYKCQIWNKIAQELEYDGDNHEIYKQWKKLRDRFVREIRKLRLTGRSKSTCKWEFFSHMEWIEPFIEESKPLEDFEIPINNKGKSRSDGDGITKSIYENGKKTGLIKFLKPVKHEPSMPKLLPQVTSPPVDETASYANYSESSHPVVIYANPDHSHTSIFVTTTSGAEIPVSIKPEVTYYIEENGDEQQQYILASDTLQYEIDPNEEDGDIDEEHEEYDEETIVEEDESNGIVYPTEILLSCPQDQQQASSSTSARNVIYAVNKHTDLSSLPENIRLAIEAQGKDVFKDKSIIYVK